MRGRGKRGTPATPGDRLDFIEGLRGIAALYVVLGHFCSMADPHAFEGKVSYAPMWLQRVMAPLWYGHLAVAAFIVISGFCLQMSLFNGQNGRIGSYKKFFKRRALRILPPYYACLAISLAIVFLVTSKQTGMPFEQYLPVTKENLLAHLLLYHNLSPAWMYKINGVLWSISAEAQLYLLFPLLVAMIFRGGRLLTLALTTAAAIAVVIYVPNALKLYPWYLTLFTVGMVSAHLAFRPSVRFGTQPLLGMLLAFMAIGGCVLGCIFGLSLPLLDGLMGIGIAALIYAGAVAPWYRIPWTFASRPLVGLGTFSFSLYLMHHPIEQALYVYRPAMVKGEVWSFFYLLVVGLPVILLGCWLFAKAFEHPFVPARRTHRFSRYADLIPCSLPLVAAGVLYRDDATEMESSHRSEISEGPVPMAVTL